ncbi:MAG: Lrp/AsnC family transcriptional regulator [Rhodospirillaceae bacterium]|jgi:Lrp/AsnC family transcriptional regulator, leucine-responsive regulatory protein|nr:Lrp/AsnC family transcriptional regulator [Rhodospirillaceae bacterium]
MDDIDRQIIAALQDDGRASPGEVGVLVGLSVSAVNERMRKLREAGVITGYSARIDPDAVGLGVLAFISVLIDWSEHNAAFLDAVEGMADVLECHHVTGDWSYLLKVRTRSNAALEELITNQIKTLPGVTRSETVIVLRAAKETAALPV